MDTQAQDLTAAQPGVPRKTPLIRTDRIPHDGGERIRLTAQVEGMYVFCEYFAATIADEIKGRHQAEEILMQKLESVRMRAPQRSAA